MLLPQLPQLPELLLLLLLLLLCPALNGLPLRCACWLQIVGRAAPESFIEQLCTIGEAHHENVAVDCIR